MRSARDESFNSRGTTLLGMETIPTLPALSQREMPSPDNGEKNRSRLLVAVII